MVVLHLWFASDLHRYESAADDVASLAVDSSQQQDDCVHRHHGAVVVYIILV